MMCEHNRVGPCADCWKARYADLHKALTHERERAERYRVALEKVTRLHDERCSSLMPNHPDMHPYDCDCGRDEARAALANPPEEEWTHAPEPTRPAKATRAPVEKEPEHEGCLDNCLACDRALEMAMSAPVEKAPSGGEEDGT